MTGEKNSRRLLLHEMLESPDHLTIELKAACHEAFRPILRNPSVRVRDIRIRTISSLRFDFDKEVNCYVVSVKTNNASWLRGDSNAFKGSYKERVEGVLDLIVKRHDPTASAHLEIRGPSPRSVEAFIGILELIDSGQLRDESPLTITAAAYGIPAALVRGRHLIGPSPALATVLEDICARKKVFECGLDIFAGTGLATKVMWKRANPRRLVIIERDQRKIMFMRRHLRGAPISFKAGDACAMRLPAKVFDLVVADPYYEDVPCFLRAHLAWIRRYAQTFVLVSGGVENLQWNAQAFQLLRAARLKPERHCLYGQVIIECGGDR